MKNYIKYIWKHYVKLEHEPDFYIDPTTAFCECGRRIYLDKNKKWVEV